MKALVTGTAGFIGAALAAQLVASGWQVLGADVRRQRQPVPGRQYETEQVDLVDAESIVLDRLLDGVDVVFHLAGQPGVRMSWAEGFSTHLRNNLECTQRLLEAARRRPVARFVHASSSAVYGNVQQARVTENQHPVPHSPYGVTKYAAEQLCSAYAANFGVPTVNLRYFTVYGPGQRTDMSIHRLLRAALDQTPFHLYGDGSQSRDFTYISDVVSATIAAGTANLRPGVALNIGSGAPVTMIETIREIEVVTDAPITVVPCGPQPGDVHRTSADITRAGTLLGWHPTTPFRNGLTTQAEALSTSGRGLQAAPATNVDAHLRMVS